MGVSGDIVVDVNLRSNGWSTNVRWIGEFGGD